MRLVDSALSSQRLLKSGPVTGLPSSFWVLVWAPSTSRGTDTATVSALHPSIDGRAVGKWLTYSPIHLDSVDADQKERGKPLRGTEIRRACTRGRRPHGMNDGCLATGKMETGAGMYPSR